MTSTRRIKALDERTINRIAAGEIIIAPANALKELLENSIDAGSKNIEVIVKEGGLKLLQITDNGCGINRDDLALLCQRFTTSKLQDFEDLQSLSTYGFRGEALASISHVSRLTVTTKTEESPTAFKAIYSDGVMKQGSLKATAGKKGTQIVAEDLFYNVPSRLKAFRSANEEYTKILDVVNRYSIHTENVAFLCKRKGDTHPSLVTQQNASLRERIRNVYGSEVTNELLELDTGSTSPENMPQGLLSASGMITNANYSSKKAVSPLFFINHRLVSCEPLRRAIMHIYSMFLPKGARPFIYLSLNIDPKILDVNIHPTKREVRFLYEEEIVDFVCQRVQLLLSAVDTSRNYETQTVLPVSLSRSTLPIRRTEKRSYEYDLVRTDPKQSKIDWSADTQVELISAEPTIISGQSADAATEPSFKTTFTPTKLSSVKSLRKEVENQGNTTLTSIVESHTYVGVVDFFRRLVAVQYDVKLLLIDYGAMSKEFFYQVGLSDFGNFGIIKFEHELSILDLLKLDESFQEPLEPIVEQLVDMKEMMEEYFSIHISEDGGLLCLPLLLNGYTPPMSKLPALLYNIGTRVDWQNETECLRGILLEIAAFYVPAVLDNEDDSQALDEMSKTIEHTLFPAFKKRLIGSHELLKSVVEIANLPGLYKVFERC